MLRLRSFPPSWSALLGALIVVGATGSAVAAPIRYDFDSDADLTSDGWTFHTASTGMPTFSGGMLTIDTVQHSEWILYDTSGAPWFSASDTSGWWVEARLRVTSAVGCGSDAGIGLWLNPGDFLVGLHLESDKAAITYAGLQSVPFDTTDEFHVYRMQNLGARHIQLLIDGELKLDLPSASGAAGSTVALGFGDMGACMSSKSTWDYLEYDIVAPAASTGDPDGDGVDGATDNCALVANQSQADGDGDRMGDACDPCPNDAQNDVDRDDLCADVDPCPTDARNDSDGNGICDLTECEMAPPGSCLAVCGCSPNPCGNVPIPFPTAGCAGFFGFDPIGGFGGTTPLGGSGGSGVGGTQTSGTTGGGTGGRGGTGGSGAQAGRGGNGGTGALAGSGGASATGGSVGAGAGGAPGGNQGDDTDATSADKGGCTCSLARAPGADRALAWLGAAAVAATVVRRRRRRH